MLNLGSKFGGSEGQRLRYVQGVNAYLPFLLYLLVASSKLTNGGCAVTVVAQQRDGHPAYDLKWGLIVYTVTAYALACAWMHT